MARPYPYYPAFDGKGAQPGTVWFVGACERRWKCKNIGIYNVRLMKNDHTAGKKIGDPGMDKYLSVHSTGAAADIQYPSEDVAREMWDWFLNNSAALGICEVHWYAYGDFGAGYRCSRGEGKAGVKIFTKDDNAGSYQGSPNWLHVEISPELAKDAAKMEAAWKALPKPGA